YKDYRDPPWSVQPYTFSKQYWSVLAARLAFVIFFQNLAMFLSMLVAWLIPDIPRSLREQIRKENMLLMDFLLQDEQKTLSSKPNHHLEKSEGSKRSGHTLDHSVNIDPDCQESERGEEKGAKLRGGGVEENFVRGGEEGGQTTSELDHEDISVVDLDSVMDQLYLLDPHLSQELPVSEAILQEQHQTSAIVGDMSSPKSTLVPTS
ncbi:hypothetical protein DPEC_G00158590, partial [Dallia pectoralis]